MNWIKLSLLTVIIAIIYLSLKAPSGGVNISVNDKIGHLLAYSTLTFNTGLLFSKNKWTIMGILILLFSALLEFLQGFVPGREVDWKDLIANASGVIIGIVLLFFLKEKCLEFLKKLKIVY